MIKPTPHRTTPLAICLATLIAVAAGCRQAPPDTREADLAALRQADAAFEQAAAAKNLDALMAYYADDVAMMMSNVPVTKGRDAVRQAFSQMLALPGYSITWQATDADVARSGDLGYTSGTYQDAWTDPKAKQVTDKGKYVTIWKKQADGSWKVVVDMANSDLPAAP